MILDFSTVEVASSITGDFVLSKISPEQIFRQYFGEFEPYKKTYSSVFRKDKTPSTGFYYGLNGSLRYKDLGTGERWDCFAFVAQLYGIKYIEAIRKIACDFGLVKCGTEPIARKTLSQNASFDKKVKEETIIQIIPGVWSKEHRDYWKQYEITKAELDFHKVFPVEQLFINKQYIGNKDNSMRFAYLLKTPKKEYIKVYTPYATDRWKWVSNVPLSIPFGLDTLNFDSKTLFVTKSLKDMIVLRKIFPSVIATQNESESCLSPKMIDYLKEKFERRVIVWDNDPVGVENCTKFNNKGFDYFNIPQNYIYEGIKDPADFVRGYGINKLKQLFKQKNLL